jgi:hypothetical protein
LEADPEEDAAERVSEKVSEWVSQGASVCMRRHAFLGETTPGFHHTPKELMISRHLRTSYLKTLEPFLTVHRVFKDSGGRCWRQDIEHSVRICFSPPTPEDLGKSCDHLGLISILYKVLPFAGPVNVN